MGKSPYLPVIYSYLKKYQEDPSSRVFAPLAEAYRKAGLVDEALEIAREGIQVHPSFVGGRVAYARALFDKKKYVEVTEELSSIVRDVPDNLMAQRLMAEASLLLGNLAESLNAYKMLLYFMPQDAEIAKIVDELETEGYDAGTFSLRTDTPSSDFSIRPAQGAIEADPEARKRRKIKRIELLQNCLQKIERYRLIYPNQRSK